MSDIKVGNRTYSLGSVLGVGGFSEVRKGVDKETRKRVALKIMFTKAKGSSSELKQQLIQVQKEIKAMKALGGHPNLVRLLGYDLKCEVEHNGEKKKAIVMVQQLAPKGELFDYLMYTKKFEEPEAIALFHQLIAGLQAMHKAGIAHRDLKPENVLFDNQFNLKLADFGFAFAFQKGGEGAQKTAMRTELGTKGYMAPQIIENKKYTEKADIFAAGVILFITLAGFPPFQNAVAKDWWFDKLMKKKYKLFWMAHERTAKFSEEAKDILQKMLAPLEKDRLDVYTVQQTAFWKKSCLTKEKLVSVLKQRKKKVDTEKAKEPSRDTLIEIAIPEGGLLPGAQPILLSSLLHNKFVSSLEDVTSVKDLSSSLSNITEQVGCQKDLRQAISELDDAKASEAAKKLAENAGLAKAELPAFLKELGIDLNEQLAGLVSDALKKCDLGVIDDYNIVKKFAAADKEAKLPTYEIYKEKAHSYKTKMSYGLAGYCLQKFIAGQGQLEVVPSRGLFRMNYRIKKTVTLPKETKTGEIKWQQGKMPIDVKILVQLAYDKQQQTNVLTFTNISGNAMGMQDYAAIVKEVTKNKNWLLAYFLEDVFEAHDDMVNETVFGDDLIANMKDGELEEEVEAA